MHAVFVVPGIMGTELLLPVVSGEPERVWPPTPLETQFGYKRTRKLASPDVRPGAIIEQVLCIDFYKPLLGLLATLGFTESGARQRLYKFPYDWRLDLFDLADNLATAVANAVADGATQVSIVAHSMGGLISRLLLEDPRFQGQSWFGAIDQLIAIATPHLGAPLALARVLGQDSALGISGTDFAWLASQEAYPSAYQLLPAPGEAACWNQSDPALASLDIYGAAGVAQLKLKPKLVARVKAMHDLLGAGHAPANVRYFYFGATGHRTVTRINVFTKSGGDVDLDRTVLTQTDNGGDGTVPLYSALPRPGQRQIVTNEHATAFKGAAFRRVFLRLLGGDEGPALETLGAPELILSVESPIVATDQSVELLLFADDAGEAAPSIDTLSGTLVLTRIRDEEATVVEESQRIPLNYSGPALCRLRLYLDPIAAPGHYQVRLEDAFYGAEPVAFSVCAELPTANEAPGAEAPEDSPSVA
ncbi:MAG: hypothetical protein V4475_12070 [Pseudomonadota bacterium]